MPASARTLSAAVGPRSAPPPAAVRARRPSARYRASYWTWWLPVFVAIWGLVVLVSFADPTGILARHWPLFMVGALGALIGNATAIGGGLVFVPAMILLYGLPPVAALKLALAAQCFGMTSGAVAWAQRGGLPRAALHMALPGLILGSTISTLVFQPNPVLVKGLFGPVSMLVGLLVLLLHRHRGSLLDAPERARAALFFVSAIGGLLTGWVAVGEGEIVAAFLMVVFGMRSERAIALGVALLAINSVYLVLLHQAFLGGIPWEMALCVGFGCVFGARLGPFVAERFGPSRLKKAFAVIAIADGAVMLWQFLS